MNTLDADDEQTGSRRLPAGLAAKIAANLDQLSRLTDEATPSTQFRVLGPISPAARTEVDFHYVVDSGGPSVGVMVIAEAKAVTRTEKSDDDRFHLDVNVSLEGLDAYEVQSVQRVLTRHLRSLLVAARQENSEARITQLLRAVAPPDPLADVELKIVEDTVALRREFLERVPVLTSAQLHERAGFPGANPSATGHRWRKQGKVFSISHGGRELYPGFQFGPDGRPLPIIAELLAILGRDKDRTDWDNALWFTGESGWLDGKTPLELLQSGPELVKQAAEQEVLRDEP